MSAPDANTVTLLDLFGSPADSISFGTYASGGTAARIYTLVTPYQAVDLPFLKYTQSADTMTLCCVNTETQTEYPSYELVRSGATNWTLTQDSFASSIAPPVGVTVTAQSSTTPSTYYSYVVTAVDASTGEESVASAAASVQNNDIAVYAGSNSIAWVAVPGAGSYNILQGNAIIFCWRSSGIVVRICRNFAGAAVHGQQHHRRLHIRSTNPPRPVRSRFNFWSGPRQLMAPVTIKRPLGM